MPFRVPCAALGAALVASAWSSVPALADAFVFTTGTANNLIATASRPGPASGVNQETESADDFVLSAPTQITSATFTGLLPTGVPLSSISQVVIEIYRVFPNDSDTVRTPNVPTRANSPSDVELTDRNSSTAGDLSFTTALLNGGFTVLNSVDTGINPSPLQHTGGEGQVTGQEVRFNVNFTTPIDLPPDHYFFVPQVLLSDPSEHFLWLSADRPIVPPNTPFMPDLQSWIRNDELQPDWLRVGGDIVGGTTFNAAFSLEGTVPEPATLTILAAGASLLAILRRRRSRP